MSEEIYETETKRIALECASRCPVKGDVRVVLKNAALFEAWLKGDDTEVAVQLAERFD
jgi:hypothetical protein